MQVAAVKQLVAQPLLGLGLRGYAKRLWVSNLPWRATAADVAEHVGQYGKVNDVTIPLDSQERSRGYAFVEMEVDAEADAAKSKLDQSEFQGRRIFVNDARPKQEGGGERRPRERRAGGWGGSRWRDQEGPASGGGDAF